MRAVRRGEAAYLELMREAKAQFDAEIAKNKEKGKSGRPRKEVVPVAVEVDDIEIDFSDVAPELEAEEPVVVVPKPAPVKAAPAKAAPAKKAVAKKTSPPPKAKKKVAKKVVAKKPKPKRSKK
jgi:hypothetical protein